jgi:D-lactate dehydrogenase
MIISFVETEPWEQSFFAGKIQKHELTFNPDPIDKEYISSETHILSPFIYSIIDKDILDRLPHLQLIATRSTGMDHIDIDECKKRNILVKNVPAYGINTIAEHTFALILALSRKILPSIEQTRKGSFSLDNLRGFELSGKTIGIIGLGSIGMRVMELAQSFHMNIVVNTRSPNNELTQKYHMTYTDLPTLLEQSDIVTIHVPATPETHYLINKSNIGTMKKGSILINTARGAVVETEALVWALEQGILSGVGLDVLEEEKALKEERQLLAKQYMDTGNLRIQILNHVLLHNENVIITPHNAFNSQEALQEILDQTAETINQFLNDN